MSAWDRPPFAVMVKWNRRNGRAGSGFYRVFERKPVPDLDHGMDTGSCKETRQNKNLKPGSGSIGAGL
jgi:hypothetical protein